MPLGYLPTNFDDDFTALGYTDRSDQTNPLAHYKGPPAPAAFMGPNWAAWAQGYGDWEHYGALSPVDITHVSSTYGMQTGVDGTWQNVTPGGGAVVGGLVGSWMSSYVSFSGTPTTLLLTGPGVGTYGTFVQGKFSADLTAKFDFLQLTEDFGAGTPENLLGLNNAGVSGNVQYLVKLEGATFVEPTGGFSFTRTMFNSGAATLGLMDASLLRLQAGARWGTTFETNGVSVEASLRTLVYSNIVAQGTCMTTGAFAGSAIVPTDQGLVRGELDPELTFELADNYTVILSGQARFGQDLEGGSVKLALRKQW